MTLHKSFIFSATIITLLSGCGGSSDSDSNSFEGNSVTYTGVTTPATITSDNSTAMAESSAAVTKSLTGDNSGSLPFGITSTNNTQSKEIGKTVSSIFKQALESTKESSNLPIGISEEVPGDCGGTLTTSGSESSFSAIFDNYCVEGVTLNGTMTGTATDSSDSWNAKNITVSTIDGTFTMSGTGKCTTTENDTAETEICTDTIKVTKSGVTKSYSSTETCTWNKSTYVEDCTETENFKGDNGQIYQVEDTEVSGDNTTGWDVSGTFYDPTYGSLDFNATNILYCDNGNIESGSITLTDESNHTLVVTFISCTEMTISLDNGTATTVNQ